MYRNLNLTHLLPLGILLALGLGGCASHRPKQSRAIEQILETETGGLDQSLAERIMTEVPTHSKSRAKVEGEIRRGILFWIHYYSVRDRERFERILQRGEIYRPLVQHILEKSELPSELYYLAMIESGYVNHATSTTRAVGIWQFMRPTAIRYGLGVDPAFDERTHPIASTYAATKYLTSLHKQFQSWYLAIAAYNCGEGCVKRAIRDGKSRDFWTLADHGYLPRETMDYIPKFLAAATIGNHPARFGFKEYQSPEKWPEEVEAVRIRPGLKLSSVAKIARLSEHELLRLNPQLPHILASAGTKKFRIWVPKTSVKYFAGAKTSVAAKS